MGTHFNGITTVAGATRRYRSLAKKHHPDVGGDQLTMTEINAEYQALLERLRTPSEPSPNLHADYQPKEREPIPERKRPPVNTGGLADLLSDEEITDVADALADTASKLVGLGVRAVVRRLKQRSSTR